MRYRHKHTDIKTNMAASEHIYTNSTHVQHTVMRTYIHARSTGIWSCTNAHIVWLCTHTHGYRKHPGQAFELVCLCRLGHHAISVCLCGGGERRRAEERDLSLDRNIYCAKYIPVGLVGLQLFSFCRITCKAVFLFEVWHERMIDRQGA